MDNIKCIHVKFNQYLYKYQEKSLTVPEQKLLKALTYGILKSGHVHVTKIGSVLQESISLKKTCKRLRYHLGKKSFFQRLLDTHLRANRHYLSRCKYLVIDGSDVTKRYAQKMEALASVHDGSTGKISSGYWQMNMIGVNPTTSSTTLASSRLYSFQAQAEPDDLSENTVILEELSRIDRTVAAKQTVVIDRGGDRRVLIEQFLRDNRPFIIRQTGKRHIFHNSRIKRVDTTGKNTTLSFQTMVPRRRGSIQVKRKFFCGAVKVRFPHQHRPGYWDKPLWLVTVQQPGKSRCYYLCQLNADTPKQAIEQVMEGYGCRWRIEEVHRQTKQDYHYESVCLRRYVALRNFNVLFWIAMGFLYQQLEEVSLKLILQSKLPVMYTGKLRDIRNFYLYKISRIVQYVLTVSNIYLGVQKRKKTKEQLALWME